MCMGNNCEFTIFNNIINISDLDLSLTSADVLINCICCGGPGWCPVQSCSGCGRFAEWAPLQSTHLADPF